MARVTVEDCIEKIPNRFELVMTAAQRARKIGAGSALTIDRDNDKNPVVALREVADETVEIGALQEELVRSHQRIIMNDDEEDDVIDFMDGEEEWSTIATGEEAPADASVEPTEAQSEQEPSLGDLAGETPTEA